jgi:uncharacterized protein (DUF1919 family)
LKKDELVAYHNKVVFVLKWMDKKSVTFISTLHDAIMVSAVKFGKEIRKPKMHTGLQQMYGRD